MTASPEKPENPEKIVHDGLLLAIIVRAGTVPTKTTFYSPEDAPLQMGNVVHRAGATIRPHIHQESSRVVEVTQEVLFVERGRVRVTLYSPDGRAAHQSELHAGDKILLAHGGHGFEILEDTVFFEVKQGPYAGYESGKKFLG